MKNFLLLGAVYLFALAPAVGVELGATTGAIADVARPRTANGKPGPVFGTGKIVSNVVPSAKIVSFPGADGKS